MKILRICFLFCLSSLSMAWGQPATQTDLDLNAGNARAFTNPEDADYWLQNMIAYHHFNDEEIRLATGLSSDDIQSHRKRLKRAGKLVSLFETDRLRDRLRKEKGIRSCPNTEED